ncbi:AbgT family transporter [Streptomyces platensis]|uniref:AbgT family transporter n=1 Tax=Streptomyces platensis TaxID=58346 RepID=UPI002ED26466|nr:AbgT family transporter [Streptomyces platensis]
MKALARNPLPLDGLLGRVERWVNRLPHPFVLFAGIFGVAAVVSTVIAAFDVSVQVPGEKSSTPVLGALTPEGLSHLLATATDSFMAFPALGPVLVIAMGIGVAQGTGALECLMRIAFLRVSRRWVPYLVAFVACQGHVLADSAYILLPSLAAIVFKAVGRNPVAGLLGAFVCVGSGYDGGILLGTLDVTTTGITKSAADLLPGIDGYQVHIAMNWFFTAATGLLLPLVGGFLIDRVLEPRLAPWNPTYDPAHAGAEDGAAAEALATPAQRRALLISGGVTLVAAAAMVTAWLLPGSPLRGEDGVLAPSPFVDSLALVLSGLFFLFGIVYARCGGVDKEARAVYPHLIGAVRDMSGFVVLVFAIAQTINLLTWSNLGKLFAIGLADGAKSVGLGGFGILLAVVLVTSLLNLLITSGSALWSILGTVMVPAGMLLGLSPAAMHAAFRIGDSVTGAITPMQVFLYFALVSAQKYQPELRLGTVISRLVPFALSFATVWTVILTGFYFLDLPLGPGAPIHLP